MTFSTKAKPFCVPLLGRYIDILQEPRRTHRVGEVGASGQQTVCKTGEVWVPLSWRRLFGFCYSSGEASARPCRDRGRKLRGPHLPMRKQLQRFLGFANFYRWFNRDYSWVAAHLTQLTSTASPLTRSPGADAAFKKLKALLFQVLVTIPKPL